MDLHNCNNLGFFLYLYKTIFHADFKNKIFKDIITSECLDLRKRIYTGYSLLSVINI